MRAEYTVPTFFFYYSIFLSRGVQFSRASLNEALIQHKNEIRILEKKKTCLIHSLMPGMEP